MQFILTLIKKNKILSSVAIIGALVGGLALFWNNIENTICEQCRSSVVAEYNQKLAEQQKLDMQEFQRKLNEQREEMNKRKKEALDRAIKRLSTDKDTEEKIKYIKEKVYVENTCDVVPSDLNRMFNESIQDINTGK